MCVPGQELTEPSVESSDSLRVGVGLNMSSTSDDLHGHWRQHHALSRSVDLGPKARLCQQAVSASHIVVMHVVCEPDHEVLQWQNRDKENQQPAIAR
jgi:hypothetical protein